MGIRDIWRRKDRGAAPEQKGAAEESMVRLMIGGGRNKGGIPQSWSGRTTEGYEGNPYVFKCINTRAKAVSYVRPIAYDKKGDELPEDHPLVRLLAHPNPSQSGAEFVHTIEYHIAMMGNAFILPIVSKVKGGVMEMHLIRPDLVSYMDSNNIFAPVASWTVQTGEGMLELPPEGLIHIHTMPGRDNVLGAPPLQAAGLSIAQQNVAREWNRSILDNGGKPTLAVTTPATMTREDFDDASSRLREGYAGAQNAGKIMLFDGGKDAKELGLSPLDMDWSAGMQISAKEIAIAMEVPPEKVGDSANKTYSNMQEANREFATSFVDPECNLIWSPIGRALSKHYTDLGRLSYDRAMIPGIKDDETAVMATLNNVNYLTLNEKREALGYEPITGGDEIMLPMGLITLAEAQAAPEEIPRPEEEDGDDV
ncbi:MAG: phage portal protein [Gammaproteobacteria bacterium]|nr:phage portal protein [Gammaproteobacteria bacterium]